jgi:hypothetical protein
MNLTSKRTASLVSALLFVSSAFANPFGTNITISDKNYAGNGWYSNREDQETENNPNTVTSQQWDLEGMFLSGSELTLVGGFDFKNGVYWAADRHLYKTGDIFIDINGDAKYGTAANGNSGATTYGNGPHAATMANSFGWDYVLDLNFTTMTYNVVSLSAQSIVTRVMDVASSNPWTYSSGGTALSGYQNQSMTYTAGLTNASTGFQGDSTNTTGYSTGSNQHYALQVDLSFLAGQTATFHYTMECGNDNLMGQAHVPEFGSSVLLFGAALLGLAGVRRKLAR